MTGSRRNVGGERTSSRVGLEGWEHEERGEEKAAFIRRDQTTMVLCRVQMRSAVGSNGVRRDF